jgi:type IV pilus assembly protein PilQ
MKTRFRITVLSLFAAAGLGVAIALALSTRPAKSTAHVVPLPAPAGAGAADAVQSEPTGDSQPAAAGEDPSAAGQRPFLPLSQLPSGQSAMRLISQQIQNLEATIEEFRQHHDRRQRTLSQALADLEDKVEASVASQPPAEAGAATAQPKDAPEHLPDPGQVKRDDGGRFDIVLEETDIRDALRLLSQEGGFDILASRNVTGTVTASLTDVDIDTALSAILKTAGFVARRENGIVYVGTPADFQLMDQTQDRIQVRVYRPNYVKAAELEKLITPLLSPTVGKVTVSSAAQVDIPSDQTKTGGDDFAGSDVVMVRDYAAVLAQVDQLFADVDVCPKQVSIEAMIINVKLDDQYKMGVNWAALRDQNNIRLVVGNPLESLSGLTAGEGGLKFGFLDASLALFIDALEKIGDTNVIAAPRVLCLNKQRAEIQIGEQLGYVNTTVTQTFSTQSVSFLDVGTLLRIRPFIGNDGQIRMEVHPELSTGTVTISGGLTLPNKSVTQVTTNVMCADGRTIVIGGLIREDLKTTTSQVPFVGNLPWLGPVFRTKTEDVERSEIIVLITPRIVAEPIVGEEGAKYEHQFTQRHSVYFDKMSPIARRNYALRYQRLARAAFYAGDYETALRQIDWSIQFDPMNREAIGLREQIVAAGGFESESISEYLNRARHPRQRSHADYSLEGYPWRPEQIPHDEPAWESVEDPGVPGPSSTIAPPPNGQQPPPPVVKEAPAQP